jgi:ESF2/ABP1 family protein
MKSLLSNYGTVEKLYLAREDASKSKRRKRAGGGGGKRFDEGWVQFKFRSEARNFGEMGNLTPMQRKKRGSLADDLWCVKYLQNFKWSALTEKVAYDRRVRDQRLKVELSHAKRENKEFESMVEKGANFEKMVDRKNGDVLSSSKKGEKRNREGGDDGGGKRKFRQKGVVEEEDYGNAFL